MNEPEATVNHVLGAAEYRRLLQQDPDSLRFAEYADHLRRAGEISEASTICVQGLMRHPGYATGHVVMGEVFRDAGMLNKAEREWREALRLDPRHPRAHVRLGELHSSRGEEALATAAFEAALAYNPESPELRSRLAEMRGEMPEEDPDSIEGAENGDVWHPGERPGWLMEGRFEGLVEAVCESPSVEAAGLTDAGGALLAGSLPGSPPADGNGVAELVAEARDLLSRLGAGRLLGVLLQGEGESLRCVALGDLALIATLKRGVAVGAADAEIYTVLAAGHEHGQGEGDADA